MDLERTEPYPGDGFYTFAAVAVTTTGEAGNSWDSGTRSTGTARAAVVAEDGSGGVRRGNGVAILHWDAAVAA